MAGLQPRRAVPADALHSEGPAILHAWPCGELPDWHVSHHPRLCHARPGWPTEHQLRCPAHAGTLQFLPLQSLSCLLRYSLPNCGGHVSSQIFCERDKCSREDHWGLCGALFFAFACQASSRWQSLQPGSRHARGLTLSLLKSSICKMIACKSLMCANIQELLD